MTWNCLGGDQKTDTSKYLVWDRRRRHFPTSPYCNPNFYFNLEIQTLMKPSEGINEKTKQIINQFNHKNEVYTCSNIISFLKNKSHWILIQAVQA